MNDSLRTDIFLRFPPETIACACIELAARTLQVKSKFEFQKKRISLFIDFLIDSITKKSALVYHIWSETRRNSLYTDSYSSFV